MIPPPYKNKVIEPIVLIAKEKRIKAIEEAGYNTFLLRSQDVYVDLLTDSGTSAMSDSQWSGMMLGDEAYAGSRNFYALEQAVSDVFGYKYVVPTHQGRAAEHLIAKILINKKGGCVPNNFYFTTSRVHQELAGGTWVDVGIPEANDPSNAHSFKGNIDADKLKQVIKNKKNIPFVRIEACLNMAGGQPFSMANIIQVSSICRRHGIFLLLDATRVVENAYFIKQRENGYSKKTLAEIIREICSYTDGCTMSSKKDHMVNMGGFLATNSKKVFEKAKELVVVYEGLHTYGGLAGRDMEAIARGIRESAECEEYVEHYVSQVRYLWEKLKKSGISVVEPAGAHAVFIDAKKFYPHIPQNRFPAQTLAAEIYVEGGVRVMERGIVSGKHGREAYNGPELVRVTIPRRVYDLAHLQYVVETIKSVSKSAKLPKGLKFVYEPPTLRFFQARFKKVK
ncbi:MAG: tryptophanase [Candidatus Yanofskybacteria bacterium]|nr:tryptophanase [Candidatus Yanofskybacteria bacterium]